MITEVSIFSHEMEALLEALRRDYRSEQAKAAANSPDVEFHRRNARYALRLLELLHPRGPHREASSSCLSHTAAWRPSGIAAPMAGK